MKMSYLIRSSAPLHRSPCCLHCFSVPPHSRSLLMSNSSSTSPSINSAVPDWLLYDITIFHRLKNTRSSWSVRGNQSTFAVTPNKQTHTFRADINQPATVSFFNWTLYHFWGRLDMRFVSDYFILNPICICKPGEGWHGDLYFWNWMSPAVDEITCQGSSCSHRHEDP